MTDRPCRIDGCDRPCRIDGCDRPAESQRTLCTGHRSRQRWGIDMHQPWEIHGERGVCSIDGCDMLTHGLGLCGTHYSRQLKTGTTDPPPKYRKETVTYDGAHQRLRNERGKASQHLCTCGKQAEEWAYNHADPDELTEPGRRTNGRKGLDVHYSANPEFYVAMCRFCHRRLDYDLVLTARRTT